MTNGRPLAREMYVSLMTVIGPSLDALASKMISFELFPPRVEAKSYG